MASPENSGIARMIEAAVIRTALPKHTVKRLAELAGVRVTTAHEWLYRRMSRARTRELALALLAEMDAEDRQRAVARERLQDVVRFHDTSGGVLVGETLSMDGGAPAGPSSGEMGGEVNDA